MLPRSRSPHNAMHSPSILAIITIRVLLLIKYPRNKWKNQGNEVRGSACLSTNTQFQVPNKHELYNCCVWVHTCISDYVASLCINFRLGCFTKMLTQ